MDWWSDEELIWFEVCRGTRCQHCEAAIEPAPARERQYCEVCAELSPVRVSIDHGEGWSVTFTPARDGDGPTYWMVGLTDERLQALLQTYRVPPSQRAAIPTHLRAWGRTTVYFHLDVVQFANLQRLTVADPRTGYDKLKSRRRRTAQSRV